MTKDMLDQSKPSAYRSAWTREDAVGGWGRVRCVEWVGIGEWVGVGRSSEGGGVRG